MHRELSVARHGVVVFLLSAMRAKHRGRQDPNSDEEHRDFVLFGKKLLMMIENINCVVFNHVLIKIQHCQMQCDVEMY